MKNALSRSISLLLAVMLVCTLSVSASASDMSPYASDYLSKYDGTVTAQGDGVIKISFVVIGTEVIDEIGASKIVVEEKSGSAWIPVKTYNNTRNPELSTTDSYSHADYVLYNGGVGKTYRAKITVFGNDDFRTFTTSSVTAN